METTTLIKENKNNTNIIFNEHEQLIYNLLYLDNSIFMIELNLYCKFKARSYFRENIRTILKRGKVKVLCDKIVHTDNKDFWKLELEK